MDMAVSFARTPSGHCVGVPQLDERELSAQRLLPTVSSASTLAPAWPEASRWVSDADVVALPRYDVVRGVVAEERRRHAHAHAHDAEPLRVCTGVPDAIVDAMRGDTNYELFAMLSQSCGAPAVLGAAYGGHIVGFPFNTGLLRSYRLVCEDYSRELTHDELVMLAGEDARTLALHPEFESLLRGLH